MVSLKSDWTKLPPLNSRAVLSFDSCRAVPVPHRCAENHFVLLVGCCGDPDRLCYYGMKLIAIAYGGITAPLCNLQHGTSLSQCFV